MSNRIVHFEIHSENPEKAAKFYSDIFGWDIKEWVFPGVEMKNENRYWFVMTAEKDSKEAGINGGMLFRRGSAPAKGQPVNAFVCTVQVESFDKTAEKIMSAGGTVALPKMAIQGMAWQGYFIDLDGNIFGVHEPDPNAK